MTISGVRIRRGTVWWLAGSDPAPGQTAGGGLLANPESQRAEWLGESLPIPLFHNPAIVAASAEGAKGVV